MEPIVNDYRIQFCGMFTFTAKQRQKIVASGVYKTYQAAQDTVEIIDRQYYPAFRNILTNKIPGNGHMELIGVDPLPFPSCSFANYQKNRIATTSPHFCIKNISLTFYDERFGIGIYSFEIQCFDPASGRTNLLFDDLCAVTLAAREFSTIIQIGSDTMTMAAFIEKKLLALDDHGSTIKITENPGSTFYCGPKMKTWTTIDLPGLTHEQYTQTLYELGTCGGYGTAISGNLFSSSQSYYEEKTKELISVYNNWTALCLWDSFSMIGNGYNGNSFNVWNETYFKIYKFNLYYKFYLFKINSDLSTKGSLGITRKELINFITKYDSEVISYNFLPNLLYSHIKKALQSKSESDALLSKIHSRNSLLQEQSALFLNWFLGIIAFLSLVSVVGDASDLYDKLYGVVDPDPQVVKYNTWLTLCLLFLAVLLLIIIYWFKRFQFTKH